MRWMLVPCLLAFACGTSRRDDRDTTDDTTTDTDAGSLADAGTDGGTLACVPNSTAACTCNDGNAGVATCISNGTRYGVCMCEGNPICSPLTTRGCTCTNGLSGSETCNEAGSAWGECQCSSAPSRVKLCVTSPGATPSCWVPGSGVAPPNLEFGSVAQGETRTGTIQISDVGSGPLTFDAQIAGASPFSVGSGASGTVANGQSASFNVSISTTQTGPQVGDLTIVTNDPNAGEVLVQLGATVTATAAPRLCLTPATTLEFGNVPPGTSAAKQVTLTNCGTGSLTLSTATLALSSTPFHLPSPGMPYALAANEQRTLTVAYAPTVASTSSGDTNTLRVQASTGTTELHLHATAASPGAPPRFQVKLSWPENHGDLDIHLVGPGGTLFDDTSPSVFGSGHASDCDYQSCKSGIARVDWGLNGTTAANQVSTDDPVLDLDALTGPGLESITDANPFAATYTAYVHHYCSRNNQNQQGPSLGPNVAKVDVIVDGSVRNSFSMQLTQRDIWKVATITVDAQHNVTVTPATGAVTKTTVVEQGCSAATD